METKVLVIRHTRIEGQQIMGDLYVYQGKTVLFKCCTIERDWVDNKPKESCIPAGSYPLIYEWSPGFKMNLFEMKNVPGRSETKIHIANYATQLLGCIAVGSGYAFINADQVPDLVNSAKTLEKLHNALFPTKKTTITIVDIWE